MTAGVCKELQPEGPWLTPATTALPEVLTDRERGTPREVAGT